VRFQEDVLVIGPGLDISPVAVEHVLASLDEPQGAGHGALIDHV